MLHKLLIFKHGIEFSSVIGAQLNSQPYSKGKRVGIPSSKRNRLWLELIPKLGINSEIQICLKIPPLYSIANTQHAPRSTSLPCQNWTAGAAAVQPCQLYMKSSYRHRRLCFMFRHPSSPRLPEFITTKNWNLL